VVLVVVFINHEYRKNYVAGLFKKIPRIRTRTSLIPKPSQS
jgi:hypothetical protein